MAMIDLKKCTVTLFDGTLGTLVNGMSTAMVTYTAQPHIGSLQNLLTITVVAPSMTTSFGIVVTGYNIVITLAYAGSMITTTAAQLAAAINADVNANKLISAIGAGSGVQAAMTLSKLTPTPNQLSIKIGEGTIDYNEKTPHRYTLDRGLLSSVVKGDQVPMDVKFQSIWEFLTGTSGGVPTPMDAIKGVGAASAWVTSDVDPCNPYCVDIELLYLPNCSPMENEYILWPVFRREEVSGDPKAGMFSINGKCNVLEPIVRRY